MLLGTSVGLRFVFELLVFERQLCCLCFVKLSQQNCRTLAASLQNASCWEKYACMNVGCIAGMMNLMTGTAG